MKGRRNDSRSRLEIGEAGSRSFLRKLDRLMANRTSFMNDTKWREVLLMFAGGGLVKRVQLKLVTEPSPRTMEPIARGAIYEHGFYCPVWDFVRYREVEWLLIPRSLEVGPRHEGELLRSELIQHDTEKIEQELGKFGKLMVEMSEMGLKIFGYSDRSRDHG